MKNKSILRYILILITVFAALWAFTTFSGFDQTAGRIPSLFNLFFLAAMFVIVIIFIFINIRKMINIITQFKTVIRDLNIKDNDLGSISFGIPELNDAFNDYKAEMQRLNNGANEGISCDIEEYIHVQLLNNIIKKPMCESVSGSMTGLGLLGTFIGLIIGLKDFNTDYDGIQKSILMLLNGIKTSFLTSIYGVIFSLVFNWIYRGCYADMMKALDEFYLKFHKKVRPAQNNINARLISALEQTLIPEIKQTNENIDRFYSSVTNGITDEIRTSMQAMTQSVVSHLDQMTQMSLKVQQDMVRSVEGYLDKAESTQQSKLQTMVDQYLKTMNEEVMGGELAELRKTLELINSSNSLHYERVVQLSDQISESTDALGRLSAQYTENVRSFEEYVASIHKYQSEITVSNNDLMDHMTELRKCYDEQNINVANLVEKMNELSETVSVLSRISGNINEALEKEQSNRAEWTSTMSGLMDRIGEMVEGVNTTAVETMKADRDAAESARKETKEQLEADLQILRGLSDNFSASALELGEKYMQLTEKLNEGLGASFSSFDSGTSEIIAYFRNLLEEIKDSADHIPEKLRQERKHEFEEWYKERQHMRSLLYGQNVQNSVTEPEEHITDDTDMSDKQEDIAEDIIEAADF